VKIGELKEKICAYLEGKSFVSLGELVKKNA
jgi:hypothetical protein